MMSEQIVHKDVTSILYSHSYNLTEASWHSWQAASSEYNIFISNTRASRATEGAYSNFPSIHHLLHIVDALTKQRPWKQPHTPCPQELQHTTKTIRQSILW